MKRFIVNNLIFFTPILIPVLFYLLLFATRECSGDIGLMAKFFFEKKYHTKLQISPDTLFVQNIEIQEIPDSSFIICFGDSFAQQKPYSFLQQLGIHYRKPIINVLYNLDYSPIDAAIGFIVNAHKSKIPQLLIVESIERSCCVRLSKNDTSHPLSLEILSSGNKHSTSSPLQSLDKEIVSFYKLRLGWNSNIVLSKLNKLCFTAKGNENVLYSYFEDTVHYNGDFINDAAFKLRQLHQLAEVRNIKLIYVVAPNKSTLYAPYTDNKELYFTIENTPAFDTLPFYFNPIKILRKLDEKGEKDIYFCDDTHWTSKTAKLVGEKLTEKIIELYGI